MYASMRGLTGWNPKAATVDAVNCCFSVGSIFLVLNGTYGLDVQMFRPNRPSFFWCSRAAEHVLLDPPVLMSAVPQVADVHLDDASAPGSRRPDELDLKGESVISRHDAHAVSQRFDLSD